MKDFIITFFIIGNILAFFTYPAYYGSQLSNINPLLWIFVIDCPLAALIFAIFMFTLLINKEQEWITQLSIMTGLKYGLWTLIALLPNLEFYGNSINFWALVASHLALLTENLFFIKKLKLSKASIIAIIFLALNDLSDYLLGTHPLLPPYAVPIMSIVTPLMTFSLIGLSYLNKRKFFKRS